jgi:glycosyltransferase involved in cell wall biosynthesis
MFSIEKERVMGKTILFLNDAAEIGGGERNLMAWIEGLKDSPWRPIVTCPREGSFSKELQKTNIQVEWLKLPDSRKLKDCGKGVKALFKIHQLVQREQVVLIHANSPPWFPLGYWIGRFCRIPTVVSVHGPLRAERVRQFCLPQAGLVIAISETLKNILIDAGVSADRIQVVYSCVDTEFFSPNQQVGAGNVRRSLGIDENDFVIGCVANLAPYKGQDVLVEAFSLVIQHKPDAHCILVGRNDEPFGLKVKEVVNQLGLLGKVHFVSYHDDIRPYLGCLDLFVLASRSEGLPIIVLEAMSMAKPVVATRVDGIPEAVQDLVTGVLVPPQDPQALAANILELSANPKRMRKMGEEGFIRAKSFDIRNVGRARIRTYERLLKGRSDF